MRRLKNYLGQLRTYSFLDLVLLLWVMGVGEKEFVGALMLHVGFLAVLESQHRHEGRMKIACHVPYALSAVALVFFGHLFLGILYIVFSQIYTFKKHGLWGMISPFARGAQTFVLLFPIANQRLSLLLIASFAMLARNLFGDFRDVEQDRREGLTTWPVALGVNKDFQFLHLFATISTTLLWWSFSSLPIWIPTAVCLVEVATYWLTPRPSNKKTADWLHDILSRCLEKLGGR